MLSTKKHPFYAYLVILTDIGAILASFCLAYWIRFTGKVIPVFVDIPPFQEYFGALIIVVPVFLLCFRSYRLYQPERHIRRIYELLNVAKAVTISSILVMALSFTYREFSYSRIVLLFAWFLSIVFCCSGRYLLIQFEYYMHKKKDRHRLLMVGVNQNAIDLIAWTKENPHYGQDVVGILSSETVRGKQSVQGVPLLGNVYDMNEILKQNTIDEVIVTDPALPRETVAEMMLKCESMMIGFKLVADFYGLRTHYVDVEYISNVPLLGLKQSPFDDPWNRLAKRTFDLVVSSIGLIITAPLLLVIIVLTKLTSKGPVFYAQERIGRDEKHFQILKFRTMVVHAEQGTGPVWTAVKDTRITRLGKILRKTNLDELPQLWNVCLGNMSLVGPRPERPHFVEQFREQIPRYMARHKIKSGLTGWAQIHGFRGNTSLEERIKYDLYYMENWTLMMDIEILFATLFAYKNAY